MQDILECLARAIFEVIIELLVRAPGAAIARRIHPNAAANFFSNLSLLYGLLFWIGIGFGIWGLFFV
jgi:hypothetical protein